MRSLVFLAVAATAIPAFGEEEKGIADYFSLDTRTFFFDRSFDLPDTPDVEALTAGGILAFESPRAAGFGIGLGYYGSFSLGVFDREEGIGSALLQSDGDDISFLGEAYVDFDTGTHRVVVGDQRLDTPLADDHDNRLLPTVYEAARYRFTAENTSFLELGYINAFSGFGSSLDGFEKPEGDWGEDGLAYVFGGGELFGTKLRAQWVQTLEDSGRNDDYGYADARYGFDWGSGTYLQAQIGKTGYQAEETGEMFGLKAGTSFGLFDVAFLLNGIRDNLFDAVEAGPMYSDWQQGYGNYEPSDALGMQLTFRPNDRAYVRIGYVDVESRDGDAFNLDSFSEFNFDTQYTFSNAMKLRVRYSIKDQDESSDREDRDDFRIIFYYDF